MSELTGHVHYGYACELRTCSRTYRTTPGDSYFADRQRNEAGATAAGWAVFVGERSILSYCPDHAPAALVRKQRREDQRSAWRSR